MASFCDCQDALCCTRWSHWCHCSLFLWLCHDWRSLFSQNYHFKIKYTAMPGGSFIVTRVRWMSFGQFWYWKDNRWIHRRHLWLSEFEKEKEKHPQASMCGLILTHHTVLTQAQKTFKDLQWRAVAAALTSQIFGDTITDFMHRWHIFTHPGVLWLSGNIGL